jgi:pyrroloquinoline quinone (PQQ) biosynthesis protein C
MGEEDRHEKLASKDLENIGLSLDDFPELSITKAFWETQYYKIDQSSGISLLGYILYLEAIAVHCFDASFEVVQKEYGSKGSSFMRVHIDEDPEHVKHAIESIDSLSDHERELVWENFYQTADLYHHMLLKVQSFCRSKSVAA